MYHVWLAMKQLQIRGGIFISLYWQLPRSDLTAICVAFQDLTSRPSLHCNTSDMPWCTPLSNKQAATHVQYIKCTTESITHQPHERVRVAVFVICLAKMICPIEIVNLYHVIASKRFDA